MTDWAGAREFPPQGSTLASVGASASDGTGWSLPAGGPFLRTVEVATARPRAVVVCLGGSSTAMGCNDWGLPGRVTSIEEMSSLVQMVDAYQELVDRAQAAGLAVILATVTPLAPELVGDADREALRVALNEWIRTSGHECADFDAAIRARTDPSRIEARYAAPDFTHPNINGEKRLVSWAVEALSRRSAS